MAKHFFFRRITSGERGNFRWNRLENVFNFSKNESFEKVGFSIWPKFPVGEETHSGPDIFQDAGACSQQAGNIQY